MTQAPKWDGKTPLDEYVASLPPCPAIRTKADQADEFVAELSGGSTVDVRRAESPIETMMLLALLECGFNTDLKNDAPALATLRQQYPVETEFGTFRLDFAAVRLVGRRSVRVAIELDGHEHHASRDQRERDNRRARALARQGWIVIRFSGSEVWKDAGACALDVSAIIIEAVDRIETGR